MNTKAIREALELARDVVWESVWQSHSECDDIPMSEGVEVIIANELAEGFTDCRAFVAVCKAIEELDWEEAK